MPLAISNAAVIMRPCCPCSLSDFAVPVISTKPLILIVVGPGEVGQTCSYNKIAPR
jgi:hypothetical protein